MDSVRSHFGKIQLWQVEHFFLHEKVPVVLYKTSYKIHSLELNNSLDKTLNSILNTLPWTLKKQIWYLEKKSYQEFKKKFKKFKWNFFRTEDCNF